MRWLRWPVRVVVRLLRWLLEFVAVVLILVVTALLVIETGWAKNRIRELIVRQANEYLTATLEIGRLEGSFLRGIKLGDIRLSRDGETIIAIDDVSLSYSIRELFDRGTTIREIKLARPRVVAEKDADGRWNVGALIKRETRQAENSGPGRPIHIMAIQVSGGSIHLENPVSLGAAHIPTRFENLDVSCAFDYEPVNWHLRLASAAWRGSEPSLDMNHLSGGISNGPDGWNFEKLRVETPQTKFTFDGQIDRRQTPTVLDLRVNADRFVFQEWSGILTGLTNIAIDARFDTTLKGPLAKLATDLTLQSNGGNVQGSLVLDTTSPGWRGKGAVDVQRIELAHWLNRPDRSSDITGHVAFDLTDIGLRAGGRFPIGTYAYNGSHARYLEYEADDLVSRGVMTANDVQIGPTTGTAYGANVRLEHGSIALDSPNRFTFAGLVNGVDLRQVPANVPVPHVESTLTFTYDVAGQFTDAFIVGQANFRDSVFLGARVHDGTSGSIDTSVSPIHYTGEGDISDVKLGRFGRGLDVSWLQDPRYAGLVAGHFHVDGTGTDAATMVLEGGGRISRATMFGGELHDGDVSIRVAGGSISGGYDGAITDINPSIAMADERYKARLTGSGRASITVRDLITRSPEMNDYSIDAQLAVHDSDIRGLAVSAGETQATLENGSLTFKTLKLSGPALDLTADGTVELDGTRSSRVNYAIARADLAGLRDFIGRDITGTLVSTGQLTGPLDRVHLAGQGSLTRFDAWEIKALTVNVQYDATVPVSDWQKTNAKVDGRLSFVELFGQQVDEASGTVTYDAGRMTADLKIRHPQLSGELSGAFVLHHDNQGVDIQTLKMAVGPSRWQLAAERRPTISWTDAGITLHDLAFVDEATGTQAIAADGTWQADGKGALKLSATHVSLDALTATADGAPAKYGGMATIDAVLRGTRDHPILTGHVEVVDGRVWRVAYQRLNGAVDYADGAFQVDLRLDQSAGVWFTAVGRVPMALFDTTLADSPIDVALHSSSVNLGLLEGASSVVSNVAGTVSLDVRVIGTSRDPHFDGRVDIANAGFLVVASGSRYKNGRIALQLAQDKVTVETLHLEDVAGHALEIKGSLGTHELRVGELAIDVSARNFEVLRNEYGRADINAAVTIGGRFESPRLSGRITLAGGQLRVDHVLERTLLQQTYATEPASAAELDPIVALNPWDRLGVDLTLSIPAAFRLVGEDVHISPGTPIGLGSINLRPLGELYLYKDPRQPLYVTGSLDQVNGTYSFQGRRFDLDPASSINFHGDLNPGLDVSVLRDISGVEVRVTIGGDLHDPELRMTSSPPLDPSDILSLIVFNTSINELTAEQQSALAVRAGTLAAGFLASPMVNALQRSIGIDTLEIEPATDVRGGGARVTIGNEIAPGLVARFSRQFGETDYDEATLEYYLSRILRIRATFSDATAPVSLSSFRRVERAGIDLLLFFSF